MNVEIMLDTGSGVSLIRQNDALLMEIQPVPESHQDTPLLSWSQPQLR